MIKELMQSLDERVPNAIVEFDVIDEDTKKLLHLKGKTIRVIAIKDFGYLTSPKYHFLYSVDAYKYDFVSIIEDKEDFYSFKKEWLKFECCNCNEFKEYEAFSQFDDEFRDISLCEQCESKIATDDIS